MCSARQDAFADRQIDLLSQHSGLTLLGMRSDLYLDLLKSTYVYELWCAFAWDTPWLPNYSSWFIRPTVNHTKKSFDYRYSVINRTRLNLRSVMKLDRLFQKWFHGFLVSCRTHSIFPRYPSSSRRQAAEEDGVLAPSRIDGAETGPNWLVLGTNCTSEQVPPPVTSEPWS